MQKISEWDCRAIIAYVTLHYSEKFRKKLEEVQEWPLPKKNLYLSKFTFSLDSKKPSKLSGKNEKFKAHLIAANLVSKNLPDIKNVHCNELARINILIYSFPCQGLSIANMGRGQGIAEGSESTSNLIWEIKRLLGENSALNNQKLPKYLILENVVALTNERHSADYERWLDFLDSKGYVTFTLIFDALKYGWVQRRKRLIAISIKKEYSKGLTKELVKKLFEERYASELDGMERQRIYLEILSSSSYEEKVNATPNATPSRQRMVKENIDLLKNDKYIFNTLTTKQDRHPNIGMLSNSELGLPSDKLDKRFITPREAYLIMGFQNDDITKLLPLQKEGILTKESMYRQAGNSIVPHILEAVLKFIQEFEEGKLWK